MQSVEKEAMKLYEKMTWCGSERAKKLCTELEDCGNMEPIF